MPAPKISLVCMPWHMLGSPSMQLGTLHASLEREGFACRSHSLYLEFHDFVARASAARCDPLSVDDYGEISSRWGSVGAGEWVFAPPDQDRSDPERGARYLALLRARHMSDALIAKLVALRAVIPEFLEHCADEILDTSPALVGFSAVYSQVWPSAALARVLKRRAPALKIVLGGSSCEGPMGPALLRAFAHVDWVLRGQAELSLPALARAVANDEQHPDVAGLCRRDGETLVVREVAHEAPLAMDELPIPVFDEYFQRLSHSTLAASVLPQIPFESSRGCWWGMKSHCTFCGLNGLSMKFRSKSPERVVHEVEQLADRHGVLDFTSTDNIIDLRYFETVLPELAARRADLGFFYETKSNLTYAQVQTLRAGGVRTIQPGIESLSTPTLKLIKKGVSAFQNIRLLKWCAQSGVRVVWNLLYGFPNEDPEEYRRMAELVPALVHLDAPELGALFVTRFSPYHERPEQHGIRLAGALPYYPLLFDLEREHLDELADTFAFEYADQREPEHYVAPLRAQVELWKRDRERNRNALTYRRGPSFLTITDTRTTTTAGLARYVLDASEAVVYEACDAGATKPEIVQALERAGCADIDSARLDQLLEDLVGARLVYHGDSRFLALALPRRADGAVRRDD